MAPNLVTLIGLAVNLVGCSIFFIWDTKVASDAEIPLWAYFFCVSCLFFYQTMDAIDGKQARRTGSSSPLGQLFDHGCDALQVLPVFSALQYGFRAQAGFEVDILLIGASVAFYLCQWEEHHTGKLRTNIGHFGVTEGLLIEIGVIIVGGLT